MEREIASLDPPRSSQLGKQSSIDDMYSKLCELEEQGGGGQSIAGRGEDTRSLEVMTEDFWREMEHSVDPFETICFYISKGYLENI